MRLLPARRESAGGEVPALLCAAARVDRSTAGLTARLRPGEVAVLDHLDLDRTSAERLLRRGVAAVVNVAPSLSGRTLAGGAQTLVAAGVPLLDDVGTEVLATVRDGQQVVLDICAGTLRVDGRDVASGQVQTVATVRAAELHARARLATSVRTLVEDAGDLLGREAALLLDGAPTAPVALRDLAAGRAVLVVGADPDAAHELALLRGWIRRTSPLLVAVGGGARVLLDSGVVPDIAVGDLADLPEPGARAATTAPGEPDRAGRPDPAASLAGLAPALTGCELVALDTRAATSARDHGLGATLVETALPPVEAALVLVAAAHPAVTVCAGMPSTLVDLLDTGRTRAAASLLARLRGEGTLVSASAAAALVPAPPRLPRALAGLLLVLAVLLAAAAVLAVSAPGQALLHQWWPGLALP